MVELQALRVVYKKVDGQEIDADVYEPDPKDLVSDRAPICMYNEKSLRLQS